MRKPTDSELKLLNEKLNKAFLNNIGNLCEWASLCQPQTDQTEEAKRLATLLVLQKIIAIQVEDRNAFQRLKNGTDRDTRFIATCAYGAVFLLFRNFDLMKIIHNALGQEETIINSLADKQQRILTDSYFAAHPIPALTDTQLNQFIHTLNSKLNADFIAKISALSQWQDSTTKKTSPLEEVSRLARLLVLQEIITTAMKYSDTFQRLKNGTDHDVISIAEFSYGKVFPVLPDSDPMTAIHKALGQEVAIVQDVSASSKVLTQVYKHAISPMEKVLSKDTFKQYLQTFKQKNPQTPEKIKQVQHEFLQQIEAEARAAELTKFQQAQRDLLETKKTDARKMAEANAQKILALKALSAVTDQETLARNTLEMNDDNVRVAIAYAEVYERTHAPEIQLKKAESTDRTALSIAELEAHETIARECAETEITTIQTQLLTVDLPELARKALIDSCRRNDVIMPDRFGSTQHSSNSDSSNSDSSDIDSSDIDSDDANRNDQIDQPFKTLFDLYPNDEEALTVILQYNPLFAFQHLSNEHINGLLHKDISILDKFLEKASKDMLIDLLSRLDADLVCDIYKRCNIYFQLDKEIINVAVKKNPAILTYLTDIETLRSAKGFTKLSAQQIELLPVFIKHILFDASPEQVNPLPTDIFARLINALAASKTEIPEIEESALNVFGALISLFFHESNFRVRESVIKKLTGSLLTKFYSQAYDLIKASISPRQLSKLLIHFNDSLKQILSIKSKEVPAKEETKAIFRRLKNLANKLDATIPSIRFQLFINSLHDMGNTVPKGKQHPLDHIKQELSSWMKEKTQAEMDKRSHDKKNDPIALLQETFYTFSYTLIELTVGLDALEKASKKPTLLKAAACLLEGLSTQAKIKEYSALRAALSNLLSDLLPIVNSFIQKFFQETNERQLSEYLVELVNFIRSPMQKLQLASNSSTRYKAGVVATAGNLHAYVFEVVRDLLEKKVASIDDLSPGMQRMIAFHEAKTKLERQLSAIKLNKSDETFVSHTIILIRLTSNFDELSGLLQERLQLLPKSINDKVRTLLKTAATDAAQLSLAHQVATESIDTAGVTKMLDDITDIESLERRGITQTAADNAFSLFSSNLPHLETAERASIAADQTREFSSLIFNSTSKEEQIKRTDIATQAISEKTPLQATQLIFSEATMRQTKEAEAKSALHEVHQSAFVEGAMLTRNTLTTEAASERHTMLTEHAVSTESASRKEIQNSLLSAAISEFSAYEESAHRGFIASQNLTERMAITDLAQAQLRKAVARDAFADNEQLLRGAVICENAQFLAKTAEEAASLNSHTFDYLMNQDISSFSSENEPYPIMIKETDTDDKIVATASEVYRKLEIIYDENRSQATFFKGATFGKNPSNYCMTHFGVAFDTLNDAQKLKVIVHYARKNPKCNTAIALKQTEAHFLKSNSAPRRARAV